MALTIYDVEKIAKLSRLRLEENEKPLMLEKLNAVFDLIEQMQSVDTTDIQPMAHPHEMALRLREDTVTETDCAQKYQACAPEIRERLYIVPQVIEE